MSISTLEVGVSEPTVLAVDDTPSNLLAISAILEPLKSRIVTATSGAEALALAARGEFAVILLDVMMPGMDGFETLTKLRSLAANRHTPVILLTAYELDTRALARVQGLGMVDYILKPIPPELLCSRVAALVSLHRRGEELRLRDQALAAKDRDIAMLAHDLQNPLTVIANSAGLLLRAGLDRRSRSSVERISRSVARMSDMIRNLADYARAGRGPFPIAPAAMDLGELCRDLLDEFQQIDPARHIQLACTGELSGTWDRTRVHQAISNLVGNALRYGSGDVALRATGTESGVDVAVHNPGPPIPRELLPVIFQPFERGAHDRAGMGLGLHIVREIARAHQGEVSVTSDAEHGTTFVLRLPRTTRAPDGESAGSSMPRR